MKDLLLVSGWVASVWDGGSAEGLRRVASLSLGSVQEITALPERCCKFAQTDVTAVLAMIDPFSMCATPCISCCRTAELHISYIEIQQVAECKHIIGMLDILHARIYLYLY